MSQIEEQLYHRCMRFCEAFFMLLCEKNKVRGVWCPDDEKDVRLKFANERLISTYESLFNAVEDWEKERKCKIGKEYKLELNRIEKC